MTLVTPYGRGSLALSFLSKSSHNWPSRLASLFLVFGLGVVAGTVGDYLYDGTLPSLLDIVRGTVLSPLVVTVGGGAIGRGVVQSAFVLGGLLFWPVQAVASTWYVLRGHKTLLIAIAAWNIQGLMCIQHRIAMLLSV